MLLARCTDTYAHMRNIMFILPLQLVLLHDCDDVCTCLFFIRYCGDCAGVGHRARLFASRKSETRHAKIFETHCLFTLPVTNASVGIYTHTHTRTHTHIHTHTQTHTHTHTHREREREGTRQTDRQTDICQHTHTHTLSLPHTFILPRLHINSPSYLFARADMNSFFASYEFALTDMNSLEASADSHTTCDVFGLVISCLELSSCVLGLAGG
jgi:hypothetical protein